MYSPLAYEVQKAILEERLANPYTRPPGAKTRKAAMCRVRGCRRTLRGILLPKLPRRGTRVGVAVLLAVGASVAAATPALAASSTFGYSPNYQYFTVPSGVTSLGFDVIGGSGADGQGSFGGGGSGGSGAEVTGALAVTPGQVVTIWAGGAGQPGGGDGYGNPSHDDFDGGSGGSGYGGGPTTGPGGGGGAASYIKANGSLMALG